MKHSKTLAAIALALSITLPARAQEKDAGPWKPVEEAMGRTGEVQKDGTFKITVLRTDVQVKTAQGMPVPASMGLNSYAAFAGTPEKATVVGDTCLLAGEVQGVIDALRAGGIDVVALHNHMLTGDPALLFMHFEAQGDARELAKGLRAAFDKLGKSEPPAAEPLPAGAGKAKEIDWAALEKVLGKKPAMSKDGVGKFSLPRSDFDVKLRGAKLPAGVGLACWAAFNACPCGLTMVMGDTCVKPGELQGAIDALRKGGIRISGIHNHILGADGEVMFMHFEGEGEAAALAQTVRAAWDGLDVSKQGAK